MGVEAVFSRLAGLLSQPPAQRLGWTLVHFLWQGAASAALLGGALWLLPRRAANARYGAACLALCLMAAAFVATLAVDPTPQREASIDTAQQVKAPAPPVLDSTAQNPRSARMLGQSKASELSDGSDRSDRSDGSDQSDQSDMSDQSDKPAFISLRSVWSSRAETLARPALPWMVGGWLSGVMLLSARLMGGWRNARRLKRRGVQPAPAAWREALAALQRRMQVSRPVALLESALARVPMAIGILRPAILLPACALTGLSAQQLEAILAHELAHIRRHDNLVNLIQSAIETLLFYHPAVWWVSRRIRAERENCCDDLAIAACGDAVEYARALANLETLRARAPRLAAAAGGGSLLSRVRRIAGRQPESGAGAFRWLAGAAGILAIAGVLAVAYFSGVTEKASAQESKPGNSETTLYEDKTLSEWIEALHSATPEIRADALAASLARIGEPVIPALLKEVETGERSPALIAMKALSDMGEKARTALPALIRIARDKSAPSNWEPEGASDKRQLLLGFLSRMPWASEEVIPLLCEIAADVADDSNVRLLAFAGLSRLGKNSDQARQVLISIVENASDDDMHRSAAVETLKEIGADVVSVMREQVELASNGPTVREAAIVSLAEATADETGKTPEEFYAEYIESHPFDPLVPQLLFRTKRRVNLGRIDPLTQRAKARLREMLADDPNPDPQAIWALALIIADQMRNSDVGWKSSPTGEKSDSSVWKREDPAENYETLGAVLEAGLRHATPNSELHEKFGVALAKTRLLQGDWSGMNAALEALGQAPIPEEERPWLAAPPRDWRPGNADILSASNSDSTLRNQWTLCAESMRSGDCSLVFRFEKNGQGLKGAHVLVREAPEPDTSRIRTLNTGIATNTILFGSEPISYNGEWSSHDTFGFSGDERPRTRYAVSDDSGVVRFDKLPEIPIWLEVLIPQGNFTEGGGDWDLWMETAPGEIKLAQVYGEIPWNKPPAVAVLKSGETVEYPRLVVQQKFDLAQASATREVQINSSNDPSWKSTFPNGVEVELIGVAHYPVDESGWWRPDGSPLDDPPYDSIEIQESGPEFDPEDTLYQFAVRYQVDEKFGKLWSHYLGAVPRRTEKWGVKPLKNRAPAPDLAVVIAGFEKPQTAAKLEYSIAVSEFEPLYGQFPQAIRFEDVSLAAGQSTNAGARLVDAGSPALDPAAFAQAHYAPVVEQTLADVQAGSDCFIDLDSSQVFSPPAEVRKAMDALLEDSGSRHYASRWSELNPAAENPAIWNWIAENGIDAAVDLGNESADNPGGPLIVFDLLHGQPVSDIIADKEWNDPAALAASILRLERQTDFRANFLRSFSVKAGDDRPNTLAFKTAEGGVGVVRIARTDASDGLRLDVKRVEGLPSSARSTAPDLWMTALPVAAAFKSFEDYGHSVLLNRTIATRADMESCRLEIRDAATGAAVADIPYDQSPSHFQGYFDRGLDAPLFSSAAAPGSGRFVVAFTRDGKRCSNVTEVRIDPEHNAGSRPTLEAVALPAIPGRSLRYLGLRAVGPTPEEPEFTNSAIAFPTIFVDGVEHNPSMMTWTGGVGPLRTGQSYARIIDLTNYDLSIQPGSAHEIRVKVGKYESAPVALVWDDPLGAAWDSGGTAPTANIESANAAETKAPIPEEVQREIDRLSSGDPAERADAARRLGWMDEYARPATPMLIQLFQADPALEVRVVAGWALRSLKDPRASNALLAALDDPEAGIRSPAAEALGYIKDSRAVPRLIQLFQADPDLEVRVAAGLALRRLKDPRSFEALIVALDDPEAKIRVRATDALMLLDDSRAIGPLIKALKDKDGSVRQLAATSLGSIRDERGFEALLEAMRDKDHAVRAAATNAAGRFMDERALAPLIAALRDESADVRGAAALWLGQMAEQSAVEPLLSLVKDRANRRAAIVALGEIGDPRAVPALIEALKIRDDIHYMVADHGSIPSSPYNTAGSAARALAAIGDPRAFEPLAEVLEDPALQEPPHDESRNEYTSSSIEQRHDQNRVYFIQTVANALVELDGPRAVEALIAVLRDPNDDAGEKAADALGEMRDPKAVPLLTPLLSDNNAVVRTRAAGALAMIDPNNARAIEALIDAAGNRNSEIRQMAATWLLNSTGQIFGQDTDQWRAWWQAQKPFGAAKVESPSEILAAFLKSSQSNEDHDDAARAIVEQSQAIYLQYDHDASSGAPGAGARFPPSVEVNSAIPVTLRPEDWKTSPRVTLVFSKLFGESKNKPAMEWIEEMKRPFTVGYSLTSVRIVPTPAEAVKEKTSAISESILRDFSTELLNLKSEFPQLAAFDPATVKNNRLSYKYGLGPPVKGPREKLKQDWCEIVFGIAPITGNPTQQPSHGKSYPLQAVHASWVIESADSELSERLAKSIDGLLERLDRFEGELEAK